MLTGANSTTVAVSNSRTPSERNAGNQRRSNAFGYLVVDGQTQGFACTISGISSTGADIRVTGLMGIPDNFDIYVEPEQARYRCEISAKRGNTVSVVFKEREANRRFRDLAARR